mmetsp:Transcript_6427/g.20085  ORF Transcript_6427/g.20085 Transcript_6427/m.20085 type:complete len:100 (-) Transcript_6427:2689-2988(-)
MATKESEGSRRVTMSEELSEEKMVTTPRQKKRERSVVSPFGLTPTDARVRRVGDATPRGARRKGVPAAPRKARLAVSPADLRAVRKNLALDFERAARED